MSDLMKKATPLGARLTPPFIWPSAGGHVHDECASIFQLALKNATTILGMASAVNCRGVKWLQEFLDQSSDPQVLVVLAVFGGCPTRRDDLSQLLDLQDRTEHGRIQFRVLPMAGGPGAPANCLVAVPAEGAPPVFLFGATPNFGVDNVDRTQVNMCFEGESTLFDQWRRWFDLIWLQSAPLTEATADIPALVPASGTPAAAAQWQTYCGLCAQLLERRDEERPATDPETGEVLSGQKSDGSEDQPPTEIAKLPKLDRLQERVTRLFRAGKQVTIAYSSAVRPLEVPVSPRLLSQEAQVREGTVVQRQSFSISAFSGKELKTINAYRQASRTIVEKLALPLARGVYWLPDWAADIFECEWQATNEEATKTLGQLVGGDADSFVEAKLKSIMHDLIKVYRRLGGKGEVSMSALIEVSDDLKRRIGHALEGQLVAPVTFSEIQFLPHAKSDGQDPWAQAEKLVLALARFPRKVIAHPKRSLSGLITPESEILEAMNVANVADDAILKDQKSRLRSEKRARSEERVLDRISDADITSRDRCVAGLMLIDGRSLGDIDSFILKKESGQRP